MHIQHITHQLRDRDVDADDGADDSEDDHEAQLELFAEGLHSVDLPIEQARQNLGVLSDRYLIGIRTYPERLTLMQEISCMMSRKKGNCDGSECCVMCVHSMVCVCGDARIERGG